MNGTELFKDFMGGLLMALSPVIVGGVICRAVDFGLALVDGVGVAIIDGIVFLVR